MRICHHEALKGARPASLSARSKRGSGAEATHGAQRLAEQGFGGEAAKASPPTSIYPFFQSVALYPSCMYNAHSFKNPRKSEDFQKSCLFLYNYI